MAIENKEGIKEDIEKKEEKEKIQEESWWKKIPTWVLVIGAFITFLALRGVTMEKGGSSQLLILIAVVVVIILLSKKYAVVGGVLTPKEAEIYAERDFYRKQAFGQFSLMDKIIMSPINNPQRRDAAGIYYGIGATVTNPYDKAKYYLIKVPMRGDERALPTWTKVVAPIDGDELVPERTLFGLSKKMREDPFIKDAFFHRRI